MEQSRSKIAIISDDFTGACDSASQLMKAGFSVKALIDRLEGEIDPGFEVTAVNTGTRDLPYDQALARVKKTALALSKAGFCHFYKKIDSLMRGHVFAETAICMEALEAEYSLICPAFPDNFRYLDNGVVHSFGKAVPDAFCKESSPDVPLYSLRLPEVRQGPEALADTLGRLVSVTPCLILADARTNEDLDTLAKAIRLTGKRCLPAGSAGLIKHLAAFWKEGSSKSRDSSGKKPMPYGLPVLTVSGSFNPVTMAQLDYLESKGGYRMYQVNPAHITGESMDALYARILGDLERSGHGGRPPRLVISALGREEGDRDERPPDSAITEAMAALVKRVIPVLLPGTLILTGGETASCVLRELGIHSLELVDEPLEGIPAGLAGGITVITKSGGFGEKDALHFLADYAANAGLNQQAKLTLAGAGE